MLPSGTKPTVSQAARNQWRVTGQVQGVGFRPFVYRLAQQHHLTGFVCNDTRGVIIEAQGLPDRLDSFACDLADQKPTLAVIDRIIRTALPVCCDEIDFRIIASHDDVQAHAEVTVDTAVCPNCLRELFSPSDRRFGYGLINCTNCGPRYSIIRRVPYDRPNTTMAAFVMCEPCRQEYADPMDRRFHAQPTACPQCGPQIRLIDSHGTPLAGDPIATASELLQQGKILAIKGLGGFHLAVRADDHAAVLRLRQLKKRDHKPFALMGAGLEQICQLVTLSDVAIAAMTSPACPIVLAPVRPDAKVSPAIAPGNHRLGVMLPYTPIHHLLFRAGRGKFATLVMTSGNSSDDPLAIDNDEAIRRLGSLCDGILLHDRPIERCVDDSVLIDLGDAEPLPIRRARGYVPMSLPGPQVVGTPGLCVGGELKNTVAVVRDGRIILSQHLGDLTHALAFDYFKRAIADLCNLFGIQPQWIAHDLHPMYLSTAYAAQLSQQLGIRTIPIQHHHAHAAAVMAEHGVTQPVLAITCDGTGFGTDGTIWGGELLLADLSGFKRLARLRPLMLPGGDAAARDTRRCALALLHQAFGNDFADHPTTGRLLPDPIERQMLCQMMIRGLNCAQTSSAGRVFDGVAALLELCAHNDFEAQAAMTLESAASRATAPEVGDLFTLVDGDPLELNLTPLVCGILERLGQGWPVEMLAALFHEQFARAWDAVTARAVAQTQIHCVAFSGGVFCNQRFTQLLTTRLQRRGLRVLRHRLVPPNDGGLSYGQAAIAATWAASRGAERQGV
ncbi:MAG: carbamoyltransferase HypF [Bacillota bacterium]